MLRLLWCSLKYDWCWLQLIRSTLGHWGPRVFCEYLWAQSIKVWCGRGRTLHGTHGSEHAHFVLKWYPTVKPSNQMRWKRLRRILQVHWNMVFRVKDSGNGKIKIENCQFFLCIWYRHMHECFHKCFGAWEIDKLLKIVNMEVRKLPIFNYLFWDFWLFVMYYIYRSIQAIPT